MVSNESLNTIKDINNDLITFKIKKDGPFEFALDTVCSKITVIDILDGGIIHKHGGLKIGDQLRLVNGQELNGKHLDDVVDLLEQIMEETTTDSLELTISRPKIASISEPDEQITSL